KLTEEQKQPCYDEALKIKRKHEEEFPDWVYQPRKRQRKPLPPPVCAALSSTSQSTITASPAGGRSLQAPSRPVVIPRGGSSSTIQPMASTDQRAAPATLLQTTSASSTSVTVPAPTLPLRPAIPPQLFAGPAQAKDLHAASGLTYSLKTPTPLFKSASRKRSNITTTNGSSSAADRPPQLAEPCSRVRPGQLRRGAVFQPLPQLDMEDLKELLPDSPSSSSVLLANVTGSDVEEEQEEKLLQAL
ncbi:PREDICTED: transcription factor SOX-30-like, partial [Buceros rhinoceros silvestris]|uniref:transcription factor SOX-30-like n=1 Tax=Buceros rhinoceros silvestris TaxID=175836 RepID=UPI000528D701